MIHVIHTDFLPKDPTYQGPGYVITALNDDVVRKISLLIISSEKNGQKQSVAHRLIQETFLLVARKGGHLFAVGRTKR